MSSNTRVVAYKTPHEASLAVDHLVAAGIKPDEISVLMSDKTHGTHFAVNEATKAPEGGASGAVIGGTLGAIGATAAAAAGLAIPGIGFLAAGPIMTALAGLGAGAAAGGAVGGLVGLGIPEHEAALYEEALKEEAVLVGVDTNNDRNKSIVDDLENKTDPIRIVNA